MAVFKNAVATGARIGNAVDAGGGGTSARERERTKWNYIYGFVMIGVVVGVLIGLNVAGLI